MKHCKILILGLDAATWDLLRPWIAEGRLPNLGKLVSEGVSGLLTSAVPPLTPPAWTSFMTGVNPGKHGIFHFLETQPDSYSMRYANAGSRRATTLWRMLSDSGYSVGVVNTPFTYPPEKFNGFQISGMDTPNEQSAFIHPPELREELERAIGKLELEVRYLGFMSTDERRDRVLADLAKLDEQWTRAGLYLLEKHPTDVLMCTFMSIDTVQHYFWHHMDPAHFLHDPALSEKYGDAIRRVYERLDGAVGKFLQAISPETAVFVVSDHGGGPVSDRVVYLNRYLAQLGLLTYREEASTPLARASRKWLRQIYDLIRGSLTSRQKNLLASLFPVLRQRFESAVTSFSNIDWSKTKAYCSEVLAYPPSIVINLEGARPAGIVKSAEYEKLRDEIAGKLAELRDPRDGSAIIPRIYRREELFHGPCATEAPDLILDWWSEKAFTSGVSLPEENDRPPLEIRPRAPMRRPEWSATHRLHGVLIARGVALRRAAQIQEARLDDLAPTILHLLGEKTPAGLDGHVLSELFDPAFLTAHPVQSETGSQAAPTATATSPYSAEEAAQVEDRLKALGYVD